MPRVESGNASIFYQVEGEGPALVFAHGAGGNAASWWHQVPGFSKNHKVVTYDHRMFGRSTCPADDFHPRYFGDDLIAILDAEGIEKCALVCQSMGGWTGMQVALHHPDRLWCITFSHTTASVVSDELRALREELGRNQDGSAPLEIRAVAHDFPDRDPDGAYLYTQISRFNDSLDRTLLARMQNPDVVTRPEDLTDYKVPTLFITADKDSIFPPPLMMATAKHVPNSKVINVGDAGHSSYFEIPDVFNDVLEEFLGEHVPGS